MPPVPFSSCSPLCVHVAPMASSLSTLLPPAGPHHPWARLAPPVVSLGYSCPDSCLWLQRGPCWLCPGPAHRVPAPAGQRGAHDGEDEDGDPEGPGASVRLRVGPGRGSLPRPWLGLPDTGLRVGRGWKGPWRGCWAGSHSTPVPSSSSQKREMPRTLHHGVPVQPLLLRGEGRL